jgi:hypothetical protein
VLQGFRGELTLLDRAGSSSSDAGSGDNGEFGSPGPTRKAAVAAAGSPRGDMDDEIPF